MTSNAYRDGLSVRPNFQVELGGACSIPALSIGDPSIIVDGCRAAQATFSGRVADGEPELNTALCIVGVARVDPRCR